MLRRCLMLNVKQVIQDVSDSSSSQQQKTVR